MTERREHRRVATVLEATWHGLSGAQPCRVTDISPGGCFVQAISAPYVDTQTSITVNLGDESVGFRGCVRYVEPLMGFAVRFDALSEAQTNAMRFVFRERVTAAV